MPFSEFQPSNAGEQVLRATELGASLMDRAQRRGLLEQEMQMKREQHATAQATFEADMLDRVQRRRALEQQVQQSAARHVAEQATSSLQAQLLQTQVGAARLLSKREEDRAGIVLLQQADEEAVLKARAAARTRWTTEGEAINQRFAAARAMRDPAQQREEYRKLEVDTLNLRAVPELGGILQGRFQELDGSISANEKSQLSERAERGMVASSREDAEKRFGARAIRQVYDPKADGYVYVAEDHVDPLKDAEAVQVLYMAAASGDPAKVQALENDPLVKSVSRVPGSAYSRELFKVSRELQAVARQNGNAAGTPTVKGQQVQEYVKEIPRKDAAVVPATPFTWAPIASGGPAANPYMLARVPGERPPANPFTVAPIRDGGPAINPFTPAPIVGRLAVEPIAEARATPPVPNPFQHAPLPTPNVSPFVPVPLTEADRQRARTPVLEK